MDRKAFSLRLSRLRTMKNVSARNMSISIGQSPNYINNIENGTNLPSMEMFFYICDYLGISEQEFFDMNNSNPTRLNKIIRNAKGLDDELLANISAVIENLK